MGFRALKMTLFLLFGISSADSIQDELYLWVHQSIEPEQILKYLVETLCDELDNNELALKEKISGQKMIVLGELKSVEEVESNFWTGQSHHLLVTLRSTDSKTFSCYVKGAFSLDNTNKLRSLQKGEKVEIKCNTFNIGSFSTIKGDDCELLSK